MTNRKVSLMMGLISISVPLLCVCSYSFKQSLPTPKSELSNIQTVAVAPFFNLTPTEKAGEIITDLINQRILQKGKPNLVSYEAVLKVVSPHSNLPIDRAQAQRIGQAVKADAVIFGTVSEYWYQEDKKHLPYPEREPAVGVNARLLDVKSGTVIGAVSISKTGGGAFRYLSSTSEKQLYRVAQEVTDELIKVLIP